MSGIGPLASASRPLRTEVRLASSRRRPSKSEPAERRASMVFHAICMHVMMSPIPKPKDMVVVGVAAGCNVLGQGTHSTSAAGDDDADWKNAMPSSQLCSSTIVLTVRKWLNVHIHRTT